MYGKPHITKQQHDRIAHIFQFMEYDQVTDYQHDLLISFESQFKSRGYLSPRQKDGKATVIDALCPEH